MPKKRFATQFSKPASTAHPSLNSAGASSSSSNRNDAPPSVNDLISSLRKSTVSNSSATATAVVTPTLPPQIRHLLSQPETPIPRARDRRQRLDANGRRLPPGPPPPRSWLHGSRHAPAALRERKQDGERLYPHDINALPDFGDQLGGNRRLQDICLRAMAREWEFIREYELNNLADLPTGLRMLLLSNIAVHGPEDGVGAEGLNSLLVAPTNGESAEHDAETNNESFYRLDLSGSVGRSVTFKQLIELVQKPTTPPPPPLDERNVEFSWEESISRSICAPIPHLTHLSLSHPPQTVSWPRLLTFAKHVPTLTHLSLAYWPTPSLTPNATTAVISSKYSMDIQYGGTNYYSTSLDNDFREAATIMKRLANLLYGLEYLDLTGCAHWSTDTLIYRQRSAYDEVGVGWGAQWLRLNTLVVSSGYLLAEESEFWAVERFTNDYKKMALLQKWVARELMKARKAKGIGGQWIEVMMDDLRVYEGLWRDDAEEAKRKRRILKRLVDSTERPDVSVLLPPDQLVAVSQTTIDISSVWEQ